MKITKCQYKIDKSLFVHGTEHSDGDSTPSIHIVIRSANSSDTHCLGQLINTDKQECLFGEFILDP